MILGKLIEQWRVKNNLSLRQAAIIIGIGHTCLYRFEKGKDVDGPTIGRILVWLFSKGQITAQPQPQPTPVDAAK